MKNILKLLFVLLCINNAVAQDFDARFREHGMVDIHSIDTTIKVSLMYATTNNFTGKNMYGTLKKAYMLPEIAKMVSAAQKNLQNKYPELSLLICDAARPMSVQRQMFSLVAGTPNNIYVANPAKGGGRHNYGVALDITIIDSDGNELDMGSAVDHFGSTSHIDATAKGIISKEAAKNRKLLINTMQAAGFTVHPKEWWHFQKYSMETLKRDFKVLNF